MAGRGGIVRVRLIRPAYWTDADLHTRLTADVREFYIGLWMLADDAGYVAWDLDRIGAELYPYRSLGWKRQRLPKWLDLLGDHAQMLECGRHVVIPALSKYQSPPKPSYQIRRAHETCLASLVAPHGASGGQRGPAQGFSREGGLVGKGGKGIEGGARGANGLATDGTGEVSDFALRVAAAGAKSA
jgi:hypothetical protein